MDLQKQKILKEVARIHRRTTQNLDNHDSEITHLEPDILECEVKWALGSMNKASGGEGIPVELFQMLNDDAVKVLHSICQQIWKTQQWPQDCKSQFSFQSQRKAMPKNAQTTTQLHSSHISEVMVKILHARLQQYVNHELPDLQAKFRKDRGSRDQIANIHWITEKAERKRKTSTSALLTMPKPLTVWITVNCGKF